MMRSDEKAIFRSIHEAVRAGDVEELAKMVKSGASLNEVDERDKFTPLHWAANVGALECMHWLLWHGADATVATPRGWTPAHIAAIRGQDACVQALVNNGVPMSGKDIRGATPAHLAACHGNSFTLQSILRAGVDLDAVDKQSWTAVHAAAYHGRLGCLQLLLKWGAKADEVDAVGNTPAHLAAMEGHLPVLKFLVAAGPSSTHVLASRNDQGETPKMLAQQFYKTLVVDYIAHIEWERDFPEEAESLSFPAHLAAYQGDLAHLRLLVEGGAVNINERDDHGATPLHKAAGQGHLEALRWLVEMGANAAIQNAAGETAKDVARRFGQLAALRLLTGGQEGRAEAGDPVGEADDFADPPCGSTEAVDGLRLSERQAREAQGRARKRIDELERLLGIARENYKQLGGALSDEDKEKLREVREKDRKQQKQIEELSAQLDYERIKRERLEGQLDEYRREIAHLNAQLEALAPYRPPSDDESVGHVPVRRPGKKKPRSKSQQEAEGIFVRRGQISRRKL